MQNQRPGRGAAAAREIVVAVPAELKPLVGPMQKLIDAVRRRVADARRDGKAVNYAEIEREYEERLRSVETAAHQSTLAALAVDAKRIEVRGEPYTRVAMGNGTYYTMTGPVEVRRGLYRKDGERNAKVVDVISLRAGVVGDGWLPHAAQAMAHLHQLGTSREAEQTARQLGRLPYSRASFERVPHEVGALWFEHRADIEDNLIQALEIPAAAKSVSVSLDRTSVPMEEPASRPRGRPRKNAPSRPVTRQFRMAFCATVTLHDGEGNGVHTLRYGQMPGCDPQDLCNSLANDVLYLRGLKPDLRLALLADGAPEMWNLLESNFPISVFGAVHRGIDFWHLLEKLAPAAKAMHHDAAKARATLAHWRADLRRRKDAAVRILREIEKSGLEHLVVDAERPVHDAITYLRNHAERMNFAGALKMGLPIGSGNVEATCKTLVGVRMKRCGSRWKTETGNHVLQLRALALSDRWDTAMAKLMAAQRTSVRALAA